MSGIYLRHGDSFISMHEAPYEAETVLQELIAGHPEILAGERAGEQPRAWLLIKREAGIADAPEGAARFALDHLFLDGDGVPTLVEVKRSSDTRLRREVVGQMLDYAANAAVHWTAGALRAWFESDCERRGEDAAHVLAEAFEELDDPDGYWERVGTNLSAGRLRLVFVADEIPAELRRVVEFLNGQMTETEVLAIEVRQYVDAAGERQTIVPRVLGQTEAARSAKRATGGPAVQWDEASLLAELEAQRNDAEAGCARAIIDWAKRQPGVTLWFGKSRQREWGSVQPRLDHGGAYFTPFSMWTNGGVEMLFQSMVSERRPQRPFDQEDMRRELMKRLNAIPGVALPEERLALRPSFPLRVLLDEGARSEFLAALEWAFGEARAA